MSVGRRLFALILCAATACAAPLPSPPPAAPLGGRLDVIGPSLMFDPTAPPGGWILLGDRAAARRGLAVTRHQGVPALGAAIAGAPYALLRPVDANLLATPFLDWFRFRTSDNASPGPRLMVGLRGEGRRGAARGDGRLGGLHLPPHDRLLVIDWPSGPGGPSGGGWVRESADLAALYRTRWPTDAIDLARVAFIGIAAPGRAGGAPPVLLSGVTLSR